MAWVKGGVRLAITLVDSGYNKSTLRYDMVEAVDWPTQVANAATVINALEAVCAASTLDYTISEWRYNDAFSLPVAPDVQLEASAHVTVQDSVIPLKYHTIKIPAPETDLFLAVSGEGQNVVDIAHGDLITFCDLFDDSGGELFISDMEHTKAGALVRGKRVTRASRSG